MQALARVPADDELTSGWLLARLLSEPVDDVATEARDLHERDRGRRAGRTRSPGAYGALFDDWTASPAAVWKMAVRPRAGHARWFAPCRICPPGEARDRRSYAELFDSVATRRARIDRTPRRRPPPSARCSSCRRARCPPAASSRSLARSSPVSATRRADRRTDARDARRRRARRPAAPTRCRRRRGGPLRRELDALGVRVIRIAAVAEEMRFDRQWFVVEAGRPGRDRARQSRRDAAQPRRRRSPDR